MHEVSLALSLLQIAEDTCRNQGYRIIESVKIKIGRAAGINPDSLLFVLETAKKGTLAERANFLMEMVSLGGLCQDCGQIFEIEETYIFHCPFCASTSFKLTQGREFEIVEMEVA